MYTKYEQWLNEAKLESFKTKEEVQNWLDSMRIKNYTINNDLTVDVKSDVKLTGSGLTNIPVQFGIISGNFNCSINKLTTLEGCPKEVKGNFWCNNNNLTTLEGGPKEVKGSFDCTKNNLTSLQGCPKEVGGDFYCNDNKITSLEGCPKEVDGYFDCGNNELTSLKGGPEKVNGNFWCNNNKVKFTEEDVKSVSNVKGTIYV